MVNADHEPHETDQVVLDKALIEERVQHGGREHVSGGKRQPEQVSDLGAFFGLDLKK